jgi:MaoC like domain
MSVANVPHASHEGDWSIVARNLPDHANNPIHTDAGAQAAGFARALVAGVTSYAYCLHPVLARLGLGFAEHGEAEVRFRSPVFDGDLVAFPVTTRSDGGVDIEAVTKRTDKPRIVVSAWEQQRAEVQVPPRDGERLETVVLALEGEYSSQYAARAGDDFDMQGYIHPAVWPALANYVFHRQLARGSWIHTRSIVKHHALVRDGAHATIETTVVERFQRSGERAIANVVITVGGHLAATIEHEAIIDLTRR